jgi:c-di-GMP-binding flagellar brake protein YcgR
VPKTSGLTVRQHERAGIQVPVEFEVCAEHRQQVRFSSQSGAPDHHVMHATALDISPGGIGLDSRNFLPRMCEGTIRIIDGDEVLLEQRAKIRRVFLDGREPRYMIGVSFVNPPDDIERRIAIIATRFDIATPVAEDARRARS